MNKSFLFPLACGVFLASSLLAAPLAAQDDGADADALLVLRVYRVNDLLVAPSDYPYEGAGIPTTGRYPVGGRSQTVTPLYGGGMGGGGGGGGFGGGGGLFSVEDGGPTSAPQPDGGGGFAYLQHQAPTRKRGSFRFDIAELKDAIMSTIAPDSWSDYGGPGSCNSLGGMLLIRQTLGVHAQIEELLMNIRKQGGATTNLTLEANWLTLTREQAAALMPRGTTNEPSQAPPSINAKVFRKLAANVPGHRGRITCFDGQTVHVISGSRRIVSLSARPTVGVAAVGYSSIVAAPNIGALLQVTPTVMSDGKSAIVDVQSTVTRWKKPGPPIEINSLFQLGVQPRDGGGALGSSTTNDNPANGAVGTTSVSLDRLNMPTRHLATTLRMPLGRPVLVSQMSEIESDDEAPAEAADPKEMYLFLQAWVNQEKPE